MRAASVNAAVCEPANNEQRVFDAFPPYPQAITLYSLIAALPTLAKVSIKEAVRALRAKRFIEAEPSARRGVYRRRKLAHRPIDMRGHHSRSGRRHRADQ